MSERGGPGEEEPLEPVERWLEPFFRDPALWPVLVVLVLSLVTLGAAGILIALSLRSGFAIVGLLAAAGLSAEILWRRGRQGRLGRAGGLVLALWVLSLGLALAARRLGIF